jgi:restriction endonuclease S subunit
VPNIGIPEQKRIVTKVNQLMTLCDELEKKLTAKSAHLEKLTKSLLQA